MSIVVVLGPGCACSIEHRLPHCFAIPDAELRLTKSFHIDLGNTAANTVRNILSASEVGAPFFTMASLVALVSHSKLVRLTIVLGRCSQHALDRLAPSF